MNKAVSANGLAEQSQVRNLNRDQERDSEESRRHHTMSLLKEKDARTLPVSRSLVVLHRLTEMG